MRIQIIKSILATVILICCGQYFMAAQNAGFSKTYFLDHRSTLFHAVRPMGNDVVVLGQLGTDSTGYNGVFLARIDTFGNVKKLKTFQHPQVNFDLVLSYYSCEAISPTPENGFFFAGCTDIARHPFVIKVDSTLELEFFKEYEGNKYSRFVNNIIYFQSDYYLYGIFQTLNLDFDIFILKIDSFGKKIWEKTYGIPKYSESAKSALIEKDGITLLGSEGFDPNGAVFNDELVWNKIFNIDSSGTIKWSWRSQLNEEGGTPEGLLKIGSDYFYTAHPEYQPSSQTIHYSPEIICRDSSFNLKWRRTYGDTLYLNWFSTLATGPDSFIYAAGYIPDGVTWGRVCKIDPDNGDLIWDARDTAFYLPGWGSRNRMEGLTVLPSGSVIAVGYTVDYTYHENGLLFKVTKDGCIDTLCSTVGIEEFIKNQHRKVKVYPNPAVDEITIDVGNIDELYLDLYNLQAIKVLSVKLSSHQNHVRINPSEMPGGLYLWRVMAKNGEIIETGKVLIQGE